MTRQNISPALARRIAGAPYITFELPQPEEHEGTYVQPTFEIRYDVRVFEFERREVYDVEILDVELASAVAWIGDTGAEVRCGDKNFEASALAMWQRWYDVWIDARFGWPNRELIDAKIRQHYIRYGGER